mgnify:CR=1 FL=1
MNDSNYWPINVKFYIVNAILILSRIISDGGKEQIDFEQKESGVYFIRVIEENEKHSFKILNL